jgi:small subunit ribosomal protein S6
LRRYETIFVVNPQADDATIDRQVTAILDIIKSDGGQILRENRMGTRRLAYPVAKLTQGYYTSIIFEAETAVLPRLDRHYKLEEPYIRFLTVRFDGDPNAETHGLFDDSSERGDGDSSYDRPRYGGGGGGGYHSRPRFGGSQDSDRGRYHGRGDSGSTGGGSSDGK